MNNELKELQEHYEKCMSLAQEWGMDPFPIDFYIVPADKIYEIASYGLPGHYSHWTYGRDYWRQKTHYDHGYSKIYELIINSDPAQAFLLDINSPLEHLFVIAHCIFHSDFAKNNIHFQNTNREVPHSVVAVADRFKEYEFKFGRDIVEAFIDDVITISEHVDSAVTKTAEYETARPNDKYLDLFPEDKHYEDLSIEIEQTKKYNQFPYEPQKDIVKFIAENGKLHDWQRDVMMAIREEMLYFKPQMRTKCLNEGFAAYGHKKLMHALDPSADPGGIEFAQIDAGVVSGYPGNLNPYWLGYNILKRIEKRWEDPTDDDKEQLGLSGGEGWQKILEVRQYEDDESFFRNYLDEQVSIDLDLFAYGFNPREKQWEITDKEWKSIRDTLVQTKTNCGAPYIEVLDGNYNNVGQLRLKHTYDGRDLHKKYTAKTLSAMQRLWGRPVSLETILDNEIYEIYTVGNEVVYKSIGEYE